jgi:hypothetical protein
MVTDDLNSAVICNQNNLSLVKEDIATRKLIKLNLICSIQKVSLYQVKEPVSDLVISNSFAPRDLSGMFPHVLPQRF